MHSALYLPKPPAQLLPPYLNPDAFSCCSLGLIGITPWFVLSHGCGCQQGPAWPPRYFSFETSHIWSYWFKSAETYPLCWIFAPYLSSRWLWFVVASGIPVCELAQLRGIWHMTYVSYDIILWISWLIHWYFSGSYFLAMLLPACLLFLFC